MPVTVTLGPALPSTSGTTRCPWSPSVLHVLFAALLNTEQLAAFHIEDSPDNPVHITTPDNRTATLRSLPDGSYPIGPMTEFCDTDAMSGTH
ncbi:MAG: hypothetical protein ACR2P2_08765 [Nakamurella sp.]